MGTDSEVDVLTQFCMPFETPITIREAIARVERRELLLPGIQREFVWKPDQIRQLFNSLLHGYPIGSFLFWKVDESSAKEYQFYDFIRDFDQRAPHNPKAAAPPASGATAVLDGQQRLSSLLIGLRGTYTERRKHARRNSEGSYVRRRLYLNLYEPSGEEGEGFEFAFQESDRDCFCEGDAFWYRVGHILTFQQTTDVFGFAIDHKLAGSRYPTNCLVELHRAVTELPLVNFYTETKQDLDRVLNIFVRVNSGGTVLTTSDLLLSIATAQWEERDARDAILELVDDLNNDYAEFDFPRDFVLKACLMLADLDLRWRVENFNRANMRVIEQLWPRIASSLRIAVETVAACGFTSKTLPSANAVLPLVYYLYQKGNPPTYATSDQFRNDRQLVHRFLNVALLKRVFGGSNPDNVLRRVRDVIREHHESFPYTNIEEALRGSQHALSFRSDELEALFDEKYGSPYAFTLLAMLYPTIDFRHRIHQDHIHPRSKAKPAAMKRLAIPEDIRPVIAGGIDRIANLQLLDGQPNVEKSATSFSEWLASSYPDEARRRAYLEKNFIPDVDLSFAHFPEFLRRRRALMLARLRQVVGVDDAAVLTTPDDDDIVEAPVADFHADCAVRVSHSLGVRLISETPAMWKSEDDAVRVVCLVSKLHTNRGRPRFWYAFRPVHLAFLSKAPRRFVALGCGEAEMTALIPAEVFLPALAGMRQTEEEGGRAYWHVELFGRREDLELGLSLRQSNLDASEYLLPPLD